MSTRPAPPTTRAILLRFTALVVGILALFALASTVAIAVGGPAGATGSLPCPGFKTERPGQSCPEPCPTATPTPTSTTPPVTVSPEITAHTDPPEKSSNRRHKPRPSCMPTTSTPTATPTSTRPTTSPTASPSRTTSPTPGVSTSTSASPSTPPVEGGAGSLPLTGAPALYVVLSGTVIVIAGAVLLYITRRRSTRYSA